jgi:GntR family transcriptional regulator, trigonelline degradation regulator
MSTPNTWPSIDRQPAVVRTQVASNIRNAIIDGRLKPGERLNERSLSEKFGVSRPLLREAVRQLEAERLVEVVPNRGPIVRTLTEAETADLVDLCARLEGLCARYFVQRGSNEDVNRLRSSLLNFEREAAIGGTTVSVRHAKAEYYEAFLNGCHSEMLADAVNRYNAQLSQYWASAVGSPERSAQGLKELRQILRSIEDRDPDGASAAAENYVHHAGQFILKNVLHSDLAERVAGKPIGKMSGNRNRPSANPKSSARRR